MTDRPYFLTLRGGKLRVNLAHVLLYDTGGATPVLYLSVPATSTLGHNAVGNKIGLTEEEAELVAAALAFFDVTPTRVV
jgi:hypothetical protein